MTSRAALRPSPARQVRRWGAALVVAIGLTAPGAANADEQWRRALDDATEALRSGDFESATRRLEAAKERAATLPDNDWRRAGTTYTAARISLAVGNYAQAVEEFAQAEARYAALLGADAGALIRVASGLGRAEYGRGNTAAARREYDRAQASAGTTVYGAEAALGLAELALDDGQFDESEKMLERVLARPDAVPEPMQVWADELRARIAIARGQRPAAEAALDRAALIAQSAEGIQSGRLAYLRGTLHLQWGEPQLGADILASAVRAFESSGAREHPDLARTLLAGSRAANILSRHREAQSMVQRAAAIAERVLAPGHRLHLEVQLALAVAQLEQGRYPQAARQLAESSNAFAAFSGHRARELQVARLTVLARAHALNGDAAHAEATLADALERTAELSEPMRAAAEVVAASLLNDIGLGERAMQVLARTAGAPIDPGHPLASDRLFETARAQLNLGNLRAALEASDTLDTRAQQTFTDNAHTRSRFETLRARVVAASGQPAEASRLLTIARDRQTRIFGAASFAAAEAARRMAEDAYSNGRLETAEAQLAAALATARKALPNRHPGIVDFHLALARIQREAGRFREAASNTGAALAVVSDGPGTGPLRCRVFLESAQTEIARGGVDQATKSLASAAAALRGWSSNQTTETLRATIDAQRARLALLAADAAAGFAALGRQPPRPAPALVIWTLARAALSSDTGNLADAVELIRTSMRAVASMGTEFEVQHLQLASELGARLLEAGRLDEGTELQQRTHEQLSARLGERHPLTLLAGLRFVQSLRLQGHPARSAEAFAAVAQSFRDALGADHLRGVPAVIEAANQDIAAGFLEAGSARLAEAQQLLTKYLRAEHPRVAQVTLLQAELMLQRDRHDDAENLYRRANTTLERTVGPGHPLKLRGALGLVLLDARRGRGALASRKVSALRKEHAAVLSVNDALAWRFADAELSIMELSGDWHGLMRLARATLETGSPPASRARAHMLLAKGLAATGQNIESTRQIEMAEAAAETTLGPGHPATTPLILGRAEIAANAGRYRAAADALERSVSAVRARAPADLAVVSLLTRLADLQSMAGRLADATATGQDAVAMAIERFGQDHSETAAALDVSGRIQHAKGQHALAEKTFIQVRALHDRLLDPRAPAVTGSAIALADLYIDQRRFDDAAALLNGTLARLSPSPGRESHALRMALARLDVERGDLIGAQARYAETLSRAQALWGESNPTLAPALLGAANVAASLRRFNDASLHLERARSMLTGAGAPFPLRARALESAARLAIVERRFDHAETLLASAILELEQVVAPEHIIVAEARRTHALLLLGAGRTRAGLRNLEQAQETFARLFDPDHPRLVTTRIELAQSLTSVGRAGEATEMLRTIEAAATKSSPATMAMLDEATALIAAHTGDHDTASLAFERSVSATRSIFGAGHPLVATRSVALARSWLALGRASEAEQVLNSSISILEQTYGAYHPSIANALGHLAAASIQLNNRPQASELYRRQIEVISVLYGEHDRRMAPALANLAQILADQGNLKDAQTMFERTVALSQSHDGADALVTATDKSRLADVLIRSGEFDAAETLYVDLLATLERHLPRADPLFVDSVRNLAALMLARGDHRRAATVLEKL